jgi:hypothetical protein
MAMARGSRRCRPDPRIQAYVSTTTVTHPAMARRSALRGLRDAVLVTAAAHAHVAHADPRCRPAVALAGNPSLIAVIAPALRADRVAEPIAGCPATHVQISRGGHEIVLVIVDADQRRTERRVTDPATAAALIESFVITDEPDAPRGAEAAAPPVAELASAPPPVAVPPRPPPRIAVPPRAPPRIAAVVRRAPAIGVDDELPASLVAQVPPAALHGALVLAGEGSIASDQSLWIGVRASACVRIGGVCIGGIARVQRDAVVSGDAEDGNATRWGTDLLIAADLPIELDGVTITPGLGAGVGWTHVRRDMAIDAVEADAGGLRADVHVSASIRLGALLRLRLGGAFDVTPGAHTRPFLAEGVMAPGEPSGFARFELGLEIAR